MSCRLLAAAALLALSACGGGGSGGGLVVPTGSNVAPIIVDGGPAGTINVPFVTVTLCTPGGGNCTSIDHVILDTGSYGFRVIGSVLPAGFVMPQSTAANSEPMFECMTFADGYSWGSVRRADVQLADGTASNIAVQVIGPPQSDPGIAAVPSDCSNGAANVENTVDAFGANGIIGLGIFKDDCGPNCETAVVPGSYYGCTSAGCTNVAVPQANQVVNPVYFFATNNNGVSIQMLALDSSAGQVSARGSLVLGIDTQSNNALGNHTLLTVNAALGAAFFASTYTNPLTQVTYQFPTSLIDSGSNAYFFTDSGIATCANNPFYCPGKLLVASATNTGLNNISSTVGFSVANADTLAKNASFSALPNLAGPNAPGSFDFGLPFFFGKTVFVAFEGRSASAGAGPFVAY